MKKITLLGGAFMLLTSFSAGAQEYPHSADWHRNDAKYQYWNQIQMDQESRNRERPLEAVHDNGARENDHHYDHRKNHPKHQGKSHKKHQGKSHKKHHPKGHHKDHDKRE